MEQPAISSDLIRGHIDTIILHTLLDGDKYAQQISLSVEEKSEKKYTINQATLYSSLKRLESLNFVSSYWFDASDGRRKFFKITEKGKQEVNNNLSSWAFSRQIIDKLMDYSEPEPKKSNFDAVPIVQKVVFEEKNTDKPQVFLQTQAEKPVTTNYSDIKTNSIRPIEDKTEKTVENTVNVRTETLKNTENDEKEINFRTILSGLIKTSAITTPEIEENNKQTIDRIDNSETEKPKFNETINLTDYGVRSFKNSGNIDYSDLTQNAAQEGYKLKISAMDSAKPVGNVYCNKVDFFSALTLFVLVFFEVLFAAVGFYKENFKLLNASAPIIVAAIIVLIFAIKLIKNPLKTDYKSLNSNRIVTSCILSFNLLLLTLVINFLAGTDFNNPYNVMSYIISPIIAFTDIVIFFIVQYCFSKSKAFIVKRK